MSDKQVEVTEVIEDSSVPKEVAVEDDSKAALEAFLNVKADKKEASKKDCSEFKQLWLNLVGKEGFNDCSMKLLCDGFKFGAAKPLFDYCKQLPDQDALRVYCGLYGYRVTRDNQNEIALRLAMSLLGNELASPTSPAAITELMKKIRSVSTNKSGKTSGNLKQYLCSLVLSEIAGKELTASKLDFSNDKKEFAYFSTLVSPILSNVSTNDKTKAQLREAAESMQLWLNDVCNSSVPTLQNSVAQEDAASEDKKPEILAEDGKSSASSSVVTFADIISFLRSTEKELERSKSDLRRLEAENGRLRATKDALGKEVENLNKQLGSVNEINAKLNRNIESMKMEAAALRSDLEKAESVIGVLKYDTSSEKDEAFVNLADELQPMYEELIQDIMPEEMSIDLGEFARNRYIEIFKLLKDKGVAL